MRACLLVAWLVVFNWLVVLSCCLLLMGLLFAAATCWFRLGSASGLPGTVIGAGPLGRVAYVPNAAAPAAAASAATARMRPDIVVRGGGEQGAQGPEKKGESKGEKARGSKQGEDLFGFWKEARILCAVVQMGGLGHLGNHWQKGGKSRASWRARVWLCEP